MELYFGGQIYTMVEEGQTVEAVLVHEGNIVEVGSVEALKPHATKFIDLQGGTMIPGLVDSHIHLIGVGEKLQRVQLGDVRSTKEIRDRLRQAATHLQEGEWLIAEGWNEFQLPNQQMLTLEELDAITSNPVLLHRVCHHVAMVNSIALKLAGLTADTTLEAGGKVGVDQNGQLTGLLYEEAIQAVQKLLPTDGEAYIKHLEHCVENAILHCHEYGIVGVHTEDCSYYGHSQNVIRAYERTIGEKKHFRVHLLRHHKVFEEMIAANYKVVDGYIEFGAMKIFADGSFGGSTAALLQPYENEEGNKGVLIHSKDQFEELVKLARANEEAIAVHMIGDAAAELVISTIEKYPTPDGKRDRLIHACIVNEDLLERMKKLAIIIDIQPAFVPSDFPWVEQKLGKERMRHAYAWKTLSAFPCALGTDAPIEAVNPFANIAAAVQRNDYGNESFGEQLSVFEAVKMYTYGSAFAIGKEGERGLIQKGYVADFTILKQNLFTISTEKIAEIEINQTIVNGKVVYRKNSSKLNISY